MKKNKETLFRPYLSVSQYNFIHELAQKQNTTVRNLITRILLKEITLPVNHSKFDKYDYGRVRTSIKVPTTVLNKLRSASNKCKKKSISRQIRRYICGFMLK